MFLHDAARMHLIGVAECPGVNSGVPVTPPPSMTDSYESSRVAKKSTRASIKEGTREQEVNDFRVREPPARRKCENNLQKHRD